MPLTTKRDRMLCTKKYFDKSFKVDTKSLWDVLPTECKVIVRDFERDILMATKIQKHYRMVRYAPGAAPAFAAKQRVLMFWSGPPDHDAYDDYVVWATGDVGRKNIGYYDAKIYLDEWNRTVYYYDQVKREKRHAEWVEKGFARAGGVNCERNYHEPRCISLIKPW